MDPLSAGLVCLLCTTQPTKPPPAVTRWMPVISQAAGRFHVPMDWIAAVMTLESGGLTTLNGLPITSDAGAMGLMQIMPRTYAELRLRYGFGTDAYNPRDNIFAGAAYLRELYVHYGYPSLFAAYNAGPSRLETYLTRQRALPDATNRYIAALTGGENLSAPSVESRTAVTSDSAPNPLFFVNRLRDSDPKSTAPTTSLFVALSANAH